MNRLVAVSVNRLVAVSVNRLVAVSVNRLVAVSVNRLVALGSLVALTTCINNYKNTMLTGACQVSSGAQQNTAFCCCFSKNAQLPEVG